MSGGAGSYTIINNQIGDISFTNSNGTIVNLLPGSSGVYAITASVWGNLVALLGAAHVVALVTNPTYRYSALGVTPVATPTDFIFIQGSATKTINITKIKLAGGTTSTQSTIGFQLIRRSTVGTVGSATLTAVAPALVDTTAAAATAVVSYVQTANYSPLGTANPVGNILECGRMYMGIITTGVAGDAYTTKLLYDDDNDQPIKLRGTSDYLMINLNGSTLQTGAVVDFVIETFEDNS